MQCRIALVGPNPKNKKVQLFAYISTEMRQIAYGNIYNNNVKK